MKATLALDLFLLLAFAATCAEAQQAGKVYRIGYLASGSVTAGTHALLQGLRELGYIEGQNLIIEYRFAEGKEDRLPDLAAELVRANVDLIVVAGSAAARAAQRQTRTIPIILPDSADPVAAGLVASLSRPGGNITGLTIMARKLGGKRLELLKETLSRISRVAMLRRTAKLDARDSFEVLKEIEVTARSLGVYVQDVAVGEAHEIDNAFAAMTKKRAQAFILVPNPMFTYERKRIVDLASKNRIPAIYPHRGFVEAGGLMSYSVNPADLFHRAASYVDKILKGTKPADLPVQQPTKFELVINLTTAKQLDLKIPSEVLMWADQVIE